MWNLISYIIKVYQSIHNNSKEIYNSKIKFVKSNKKKYVARKFFQ